MTLAQVIRGLDDAALEALANRGLVRRAHKDLDREAPRVVCEDSERMELAVGGERVVLREPVASSQCSCPARGICRHILLALIHVRESGEPAAAEYRLDEILDLSDQDLVRWAGRPLFRRAQALVASRPDLEVEEARGLLRLPGVQVECRWLSSLDGMLCSCHSQPPCVHRLAALLAYQVERGRRPPPGPPEPTRRAAQAPRTRQEVLDSVKGVLCEIVELGATRVSEATGQRLMTLSTSAHGLELPRLEAMLRGLGDEVRRILAGQGDTPSLVARAARVEALRTALERSSEPRLVGAFRSRYEDIPQTLELLGAGATARRTPSGFVGLTVIFQDVRGAWWTWTDGRREGAAPFDPVARYREPGPWNGCPSPRDVSRSHVHLIRARGSAARRLSGSDKTQALLLGPTPVERLLEGACRAWDPLYRRGFEIFGADFADRETLVLVAPALWGPPHFDEVAQVLYRQVFDPAGRALPLALPYSELSRNAVAYLERTDPAEGTACLGELRLVGGRLALEPISLVTPQGIVHLLLDTLPEAPPRLSAGEECETAAAPSPLESLLQASLTELADRAEAGCRASRAPERLQRIRRQMQSVGLTACSRALSGVEEPLQLLRSYYVVRLAAVREALQGF
ncbi:MAG: SWIM zinc finger family protein [Armatimonadetes bacterium]|nr:SWIM zinc finger family protein [Armatimonadota bacterium]